MNWDSSSLPMASRDSTSARHAIGVSPKLSHQTAPLGLTALPTDTVTVTDPTHPFYSLTLPLLGITTKQRLGRVCVVWLYPGVERVIPIAATTLGDLPVRPIACRLSVASVQTLVAVVASLTTPCQEDADVEPETASRSHTDLPSTGTARLGAGGSPAVAATRTTDGAAPQSLGQPLADAKDPDPPDDPTHPAGGAR